MLPRKFLAFLLLVKMAVSQSVYPTTAVSYSTNSVPTIQTLPVSPTVSIMPSTVTPRSSTVSATPAKVSPVLGTVVPMSATPARMKAVPLSGSSTPVTAKVTPVPCTSGAVKVTAIPSATSPSISPIVTSQSSSFASGKTEPKAYFLPATIPDPKVTILPHDTPTAVEVSCLYDDPYVVNIKDDGPMTPVKRITMACADDFVVPNEEPLCRDSLKNDIKPTSVLKKGNKGNLNNPIDFEGLVDGFMSCL